MCGICGILGEQGGPDLRRRRVERMTAAMQHRGPDDQGFYEDPDVCFGFRRLSVIDLETGNQPIRLENDRAVIVLNGEIYNYRELRRELEPRHRFRSRGDVEVVLRLYAEEGIDCLRRLNGMFALAIWDRPKRTLFLARDRCGIKPLYVCREEGQLAFASELNTLLAGGLPADREIDRLELRHFLSQKYTSPTGSILRNVRALAPAGVLEIGPSGERRYRYWEPPAAVDREIGAARVVELLSRKLSESTERQLVADVPVGVFLSGGLDSSTLTALVRRSGSGPVRTFSVGFEGPGAVSELPAASRVARCLETEHHELHMNPAQVARDLDRLLAGLDGPLGDATVIPTWYMSQLARRTVKVALSGEGADELFGGYARQQYDVWIDRLGPGGARLLPAALRLSGRAPSMRLRRRLHMPPGLARQLDWSRVFSEEQIDRLALDPLPSEGQMLASHRDLAERWQARARTDPLNARLETDRELFLPGDLLPKVDRMSMAHSLEVRVPYLDNELLDLLTGLPGRLKVGWLKNKRLLRRCSAAILPREIAARRKQGFDVPISTWLRGPLREPLTDYLSAATVRRRGLFRGEQVGAWVREHLEGTADHGERLWLLLAFEGWQQQALDRAARSAA